MTTQPNVRQQIATAFGAAMHVGHGYQACVAAALGWQRQRIAQCLSGLRPTPFEQVADVTETLRNNGNALADEPFLALARELGFTSYRREACPTTAADNLSAVLREVADVVEAHAEATDGKHDDEDTLDLIQQIRELEEHARAFADHLEAKLRETSPRRIAAWTVRG